MIPPVSTSDDALRVAALRQYAVLDTLPEQSLDDLTALAAQICAVPIALISLVDENRQWFKSRFGLGMAETRRDISFCAHALHRRDLFIVPDATQDQRFAQNPMVTGEPHVRFYAGAPLVSPDGVVIGSLCVMDRTPRGLTEPQQQALRVLARQVMTHLELRRHERELIESESRFRLLAENITDVFWIVSPDFQKIHYVSPGYERTWGRSAQDLYDHPHRWSEVILPEDRPRVLAAFALVMENVPSVSVEYRIARPDGTTRWIHDRGFQVRDPAGRLIHVTGVAADITERKQAELTLLREAAIVASSDDAIVGKDLNSIVTSWNKGAEKIFGYSASEIVGLSILKLIPPDRHDEETRILAEIKSGRSVEHFETLRQTKDGRLIEVSVTISPIKDATGAIVGISKVARDITERKRAEQAKRATDARYHSLFECAPDGIVISSPEGACLDANSSMCRMFGYSREELIGLRAPDFVIASELPSVSDAMGEVKVQTNYQHEWHCRRKDDSIFTAGVIATMMPDGNFLAMIRDITEQKAARERIAEQAALLDKARDAILVCNLQGAIQFWNSGAERVYGWTRQESIGRNVSEFLYGNPKRFEEVNGAAVSQGQWNGELQQLTRDRGEITVEARWTLIRDDEGRPKSVLAINTDVTERKKLEVQYLRAQRMESIGTLAGGVAHDLNNILAPIMLSIDVLKTISTDPQAARVLETIETSARRGADIVRQVLSFARGMEGERVEVQPKHLLKEIEKIIKDTFPKDIRLQFPVPKDGWTILADATQIHQILLNLCVNARDAMPTGGSLILDAENCVLDEQYASMNIEAKAGRYVMISVSDSGTGIARNILDKIFEPFFTTKEISKGTGLGLSTVMAIVKSHGGFVNVYSEVGKGTTFKVYLPATASSSEPKKYPTAKASLPRGNGETILVVDDEASILSINSQTLEAFGYRVLTATDGADAVAVYVQHRNEIAVVLTDVMMPVMDGAATIQALTRINPAVKIIAASGLASNGAMFKAPGVEINRFLTKPYTAGTLLTTIRAALDSA